jgi:hypothetical protein
MATNGWIKLHRKELEWFKDLSGPEVLYYIASRLHADWEFRRKTFGTFDARTRIVKQNMLCDWATGKISETKNSLLERGMYETTDDPRRLRLTNAVLFLKRDRKHEKEYDDTIQQSESNLHCVEYDFQQAECATKDIARMRADIARSKRVSSEKDSPC